MKKLQFLTALFVSLLFSSVSSGQSQFSQEKESRAFVIAEAQFLSKTVLFTVAGGYSFKGTFDIGLAIGSEKSTNLSDFQYTGSIVSPFIGVQILRESDAIPIGIRFTASIQSGDYKIEELEDLGINYDLVGTGTNLGITLNKRFDKQQYSILPYCSIQQSNVTLELEIAGDTVSEESQRTDLSIGSSLTLKDDFIIDVSLSLFQSGVSIGVGYLF